jgi:hypothetical protein
MTKKVKKLFIEYEKAFSKLEVEKQIPFFAAWNNFIKYSPEYQRIHIGYIDGARKKPEEFKKRLNNLIKMSEKNKQFGYGGIEKYY